MTERHKTERLGVNAAEQAFLKMDWLFREQPISGFGIDAHAEPKDDKPSTTRGLDPAVQDMQNRRKATAPFG